MDKEITVIRKIGGYSVVPREVSHCLRKDLEALGLYSFLLSLPDGWEFKKSWLKNETGLGINKLNRLLRFLKDHNLINTIQRKEKGKFAEFEMEIYDGSNFERKDDLKPLFDSPSHRNRATETVATEMEHKRIYNKKTDIKKKRAIGSPDLKQIPESFYPDEKRLALLEQHARRTNNPPHELLKKFQEVHTRYKTKSVDWQAAFEDFLIRELPKRTWEDTTGKLRRYDNKPIHY